MCFRDRTFCGSNCARADCFRHFGAQEKADAERWWRGMKGEPPIAFSDYSQQCDEYKEPTQ